MAGDGMSAAEITRDQLVHSLPGILCTIHLALTVNWSSTGNRLHQYDLLLKKSLSNSLTHAVIMHVKCFESSNTLLGIDKSTSRADLENPT